MNTKKLLEIADEAERLHRFDPPPPRARLVLYVRDVRARPIALVKFMDGRPICVGPPGLCEDALANVVEILLAEVSSRPDNAKRSGRRLPVRASRLAKELRKRLVSAKTR